ncbi:MAG: DUF3089 domain-containing protein [Cellvibrionaceae bacterium]
MFKSLKSLFEFSHPHKSIFAIFAGGVLLSGFSTVASSQEVAPDYNDLSAWLCHPDNNADACDRDLETTIIQEDGSFARVASLENSKPDIDCFYVYPTTSLDETGNSDLMPGEQGEIITAHLQTARLRAHCRVFAPVYRQITIPALRSMMQGKPMGDRTKTYGDVLAAWNHYLKNENNGRGFVLVGHSQGAGLLNRLIASEIDGKPIQKQLVSAIISGTSVIVPKGKDVGGTFKNIPLCKAENQVGCVVTFSSYRDRIPPPANGMFGRAGGENVAGCTNPAALGGGKAELNSHLSTIGEISLSFKEYKPWTQSNKQVETPFVNLPGMIFGECVQKGNFSYLEISVKGDAKGDRADDIIGDLWSGDEINQSWGLHLIDMSLVMGNLVDLVGKQVAAYQDK